ncbi:MAG: tetratricopeptide repeat protein, partial [Candidatus Latescibacterota bacterium]|nr:tetratricopeptide repeat protein [Candidatus Latescibacterota bacterium]
ESTDGRYEVEAQLARAHLLWRVGRPDEALRVCEAALLASPADARAPELRVRIRRLREELDRGSLP